MWTRCTFPCRPGCVNRGFWPRRRRASMCCGEAGRDQRRRTPGKWSMLARCGRAIHGRRDVRSQSATAVDLRELADRETSLENCDESRRTFRFAVTRRFSSPISAPMPRLGAPWMSGGPRLVLHPIHAVGGGPADADARLGANDDALWRKSIPRARCPASFRPSCSSPAMDFGRVLLFIFDREPADRDPFR